VSAARQPAPEAPFALANWLGSGPWHIDADAWPPADAQRCRALLARCEDAEPPRLALLADRPLQPALREAVESRLRRPVAWVQGPAALIDHWLASGEEGYRALDAVASAPLGAAGAPVADELSLASLQQQASPVLRLLESTLFDALRDAASDIHFETTPHGLLIRVRLDGVMADVRRIDGSAIAEQLVSRLKVMAELDIGERRLPQDGRFRLRAGGRDIDFRLSVMPSIHGEDAVVRVLDRAQVIAGGNGLTLGALGFDAAECQRIGALAARPHGMLLVTGPTGSGKTTTLYAALSEGNTGREKIVTIEDPVEYQLAGVVQIPVNEKKGLSFARGLRSVLRHDPDRVLVGEIRDTETAQIAVQAALTGHLVFSTVHANSALDVIGRFMHMGLDLYHVVSALNAILAQRLLRRVCPHCKVPRIAGTAELERYGLGRRAAGSGAAPLLALCRAQGCEQCRGTGYRGRRAIAELLVLDDAMRDLIASRAPLLQLKAAARDSGMRSLRDAAVAMACAGETTLEELDRVTADV